MTGLLNIGDTLPLGQTLANMVISGVITDINNPNMFAIQLQSFHHQSTLDSSDLQGPPGVPGQLTFAFRWQNDNLVQPSQLPTYLTDRPLDLGKFWIFGVTDQNNNTVATIMYVWWGTSIGFRQLPVGTAGPVGKYPNITVNPVLQVPGSQLGPNKVDSWIAVTGSVSNPTYTFNMASPRGLSGPPSPLASWPDVDFISHVPVPGDILVCSSGVVPEAPTGLIIKPTGVGGALAGGTYFYVVTAYLANGAETLSTNEVTTGAISGPTNSVKLTWNPLAGGGIAGYKVYRGTSIGGENRLVATVADPTATTYTDNGGATTAHTPPSSGSPIGGRSIFRAMTPVPILPGFYSIPETAFIPQQGLEDHTITIATFAVPPQPYPWKPLVFGQMQIFGANFSFTPFLVGAEVLLGSPDADKGGVQVAQGFGTDTGFVSMIPQPSDTGSPSAAMTPTNQLGYVPANHTGKLGTLYCNLVNQGMAGIFDFHNANSGLVVIAMPVPVLETT